MGNEMNIDFEIELNNHVRQHRSLRALAVPSLILEPSC